MAFYSDEKDRPPRKGIVASREFMVGAFVVLLAAAIAVTTFQLFAGWFG